MVSGKLNRKRIIALSSVALAAAALIFLSWTHRPQAAPAPNDVPFALVDATGKTVMNTDFRSKVMLIYFGYTSCPDICPTTLARVVQVHSDLPQDIRAQVVPIFITVDPDRDRPEQIGEYVASFSPDLIGLTGSHDAIEAAERAYKVFAEKSGDGEYYTVDHSSVLYIVGKDGKLREKLKGDATAEEILTAIRNAL